jgi:adenine nucleotide transporter 17
MSQPGAEQKVASAAVQQSDNIAHALAGAGGGILSMVLTCASPAVPLITAANIPTPDTL